MPTKSRLTGRRSREGRRTAASSLLDGIPKGLPSLACSQDIGRRVASAGFDWENADDIMDKLVEEVGELKRASTQEERVHEFGDILLVLANAARRMDIELESALRQANARFTRRFQLYRGGLPAEGP